MMRICLTVVLAGCTYITEDQHHERFDRDGDGYYDRSEDGDDCDDFSASIYPGAVEQCNDTDDDCDRTVDEDAGSTWYLDDDRDGYGRYDVTKVSCEQPNKKYVDNDTDCDDNREDVNPGAEEIWYDGTDQDCDMNDSDQDGDGHSFFDDDCDDENPDIHPQANEVCYDAWDSDCDGSNNNGCDGDLGTMSLATFLGEREGDKPIGIAMQSSAGLPRDLFIGSGTHDIEAEDEGDNRGALYVFRDPVATGTRPLSEADFKVLGLNERHNFGQRMEMMDIDADGIAELLASARDSAGTDPMEKAGAIFALDPDDLVDGFDLSQVEARFQGHLESLQFGYELRRAPSWDGTGTEALFVGAPSLGQAGGAGFVFMASEALASSVSSADADLLIVLDQSQNAGHNLCVGDLNADGLSDYILTDVYSSGDGAIYVVLGGASGTVTVPDLLWEDSGGRKFGAAVTAADLDGDGYDELLIGEPEANAGQLTEAGNVHLIRGGKDMVSGSHFDGLILGVGQAGLFGSSMARVGPTDVEAEVDTVLIGAMDYSPPNQGDAGAVYLLLDGSAALESLNIDVDDRGLGMESVLLAGQVSGENSGWLVRTAGIADDGLPFLFVAARDKSDDEGVPVGGLYMVAASNVISD